MFSKIPAMKALVLLCFIAVDTAQPIFFGHGNQTQIFLTSRKDTVATTVNQIPASLIKPNPGINMPVQVKVPVIARPITVPAGVAVPNVANVPKTAASQYEMNKLFNEMKNSKKPVMRITMKGPPKPSMFPDPFNLFDDDNSEHIVVHVPYNVHTHNIHHHHIQTVPVYKHIPVIKHVPVHVVKEVAIPVHLTAGYKEGWSSPAAQWW